MTRMETRAWFFQSNPVNYDIDAALGALDRIWWRVPQHTESVHTGDVAVLWRSGKQAGIVGIGRVIAYPQQHAADPREAPFMLAGEEGTEDATRALLRVQAAPFVSKDQVRAIPQFGQHQIVVAPMGTVFPIGCSSSEGTSDLELYLISG